MFDATVQGGDIAKSDKFKILKVDKVLFFFDNYKYFHAGAELHNDGLRNRRCPILVMSGDSIATVPG